MEKKKLLAVLGTGLVITALTATASPAQADPNGAPQFRQLVGVGSDTTQGVIIPISTGCSPTTVRVILYLTPLGRPVVPDEYNIRVPSSSSSRGTAGNSSRASA